MDKILAYYGFDSIEEAGQAVGFYNNKDTEEFYRELYEEDILWEKDLRKGVKQ